MYILPLYGNHLRADSRLNRDGLVQYLRPFAQEGKVVGEADVKAFFEARLEAARTGNL